MLFINADDFGRTKEISERVLECYRQSRINAASAMVFMSDSERAADLAKTIGMNTGLHINFDEELTEKNASFKLREHHKLVSNYLRARKWNQILYNPSLKNSFDYIFRAQWDEFYTIYGEEPQRLDGHQHMHLSMNMLASGGFPRGIRIRRNFTFAPGEKDPLNRLYRYLVDRWLISKFKCTDYFFSINPIEQKRVKRIASLAKSSDVELMVHPGVESEYRYLLSDDWAKLIMVQDGGR